MATASLLLAGWAATGREMMFDGPQTADKPAQALTEVQHRVAPG